MNRAKRDTTSYLRILKLSSSSQRFNIALGSSVLKENIRREAQFVFSILKIINAAVLSAF
jgi:hypothetical protein